MAQNKAHFVRLFLALCREGTLKHCMQKSVSPRATPGKRKLLDQVRDSVRFKHYSLRTEQAYTDWIARFIRFHHLRHPAEMGAEEVREFLTDLAVQKKVAASTQNQALSALLFLYKEVLERELPWIGEVQRAKRPVKVPVVFTPEEARAVLRCLRGQSRLMAQLLYGSGLRLMARKSFAHAPRSARNAVCSMSMC